MATTTIAVDLVDGRHRVRTRYGQLRAQRLHGPPQLARVALVGQTALLLGGDEVELEVSLGPGTTLELTEVAGTIAYHGRGRPARWTTRIAIAADARLIWAGEPFVVADGAEVTRTTSVDLAETATAVIRETVVLGRSREQGGRLRSRTAVRRDGRPVMIEDLVLDPADREAPGLLGDARVIDSLLRLGGPAERDPASPGTVRCALAEPGCTLTRFLGREVAASPLGAPRARAAMLSG